MYPLVQLELKKRKIIKKRRSTESFGETIIKKSDFQYRVNETGESRI